MTRVSTTFGNWRDRFTYIVAEAQILVAGLLISAAIAVIWFKPEIPGVPPIFVGWIAILLLLGPPVFGFFVWLIRKIRIRNMTEVHHVNGYQDVIKKYYVEPEMWREKKIDGPNPYPVNGNTAWAVREFEELEDLDTIRVRGVWLEEVEDTKLLTSKSHFRAVYGKLTESHIALKVFRDSVSEFGADIQGRLINRMAEARERGKMMDKTAIKEVFEDFEEQINDLGADDLPTLEPEADGADPLAPDPDAYDEVLPQIGAEAEAAARDAAATDGGQDHD